MNGIKDFFRRSFKLAVLLSIAALPLFVFADRIEASLSGSQARATVIAVQTPHYTQQLEEGSEVKLAQRFVQFRYYDHRGRSHYARSIDWSFAKPGDKRTIILHPQNKDLAYELPIAWILPALLYMLCAGMLLVNLLPRLTETRQADVKIDKYVLAQTPKKAKKAYIFTPGNDHKRRFSFSIPWKKSLRPVYGQSRHEGREMLRHSSRAIM